MAPLTVASTSLLTDYNDNDGGGIVPDHLNVTRLLVAAKETKVINIKYLVIKPFPPPLAVLPAVYPARSSP